MYFSTPSKNLRFLASMHLMPASSPEMPDWVTDAYDWSERLVFESDLRLPGLSHLIAQDSVPLSSKLSPAVHVGLTERWASNTNLPALNSLRPWAAAMLSATTLSPMAPGVEPIFLSLASEHGKPIEFLESTSAFPALADAIPVQTIDRTLATMLANLEAARKSQLDMHKAWARADIAEFEKLAREAPLLREPEIKRALLDLRNEAWVPHLQALMNCPQRTLVAVGALHLFVCPTAQQIAGIELQVL